MEKARESKQSTLVGALKSHSRAPRGLPQCAKGPVQVRCPTRLQSESLGDECPTLAALSPAVLQAIRRQPGIPKACDW